MMRTKAIITLLFLSISCSVFAQKVGVVLSGGGAKGLYHIGVLKALEENGIPIDYISGTSMGAIIGGLYASGYSPDQIAEIFKSDAVSYWMSGRIEDRYIYHFKKPRPSAAILNLRMDFTREKNKAIVFPTNLIPSRQLDLAFIEFFSAPQAQCEGNFNDLFVPFRCVATDGSQRSPVVFRDGNLGKAIRASMTIPLVFKPLPYDSTLLYDGGMVNNFPWEVLEEDFAPDIFIGSKCIAENSGPEEDNVVEQMLSLTMMHTDFDLPHEDDILIEHVFKDVSVLDFSKADYTINRGYADAIDAMPVIRERIERRVTQEEILLRRLDYKRKLPYLVFDKFDVTGLNEYQANYVEKAMNLQKNNTDENKPFNFRDFKSEYFKLLSEGEIEGDFPAVTFNDSSKMFELGLNLRTKGSFKVKFGGNISSTSMNQAYAGVEYHRLGRASHTYTADAYVSSLYTSLYAGGRTDFVMRVPLAFDYAYSFNYYNYFRSNFGGISRSTDIVYSKYSDSYFTGGLSMPVDRFVTISLRINATFDNYRYFQTQGYTDDDAMDRTKFNFWGAKFELERNSFNYLIYPTRGVSESISAIYVDGRERFYPGTPAFNNNQQYSRGDRSWLGVQFKSERYFSPARWLSLGYMGQAVFTTHPDFSNDFSTNLTAPAFTPTMHSHMVYLKDFRSKSFLTAGIMPIIEFTPKLYLSTSIYGFVPLNIGAAKQDIRKNFRYIFNSAFVFQSPIGPVSLAVSKYDTQNKRGSNWFLTFNMGFTIFNKKGLFY